MRPRASIWSPWRHAIRPSGRAASAVCTNSFIHLSGTFEAMDPIVSTHWLSDAGPDVVLVDVRWYPDGRDPHAEFTLGHLPGAVLAPLEEVCSDPPSDARGRHPLPTPESFAARLFELGIGDG